MLPEVEKNGDQGDHNPNPDKLKNSSCQTTVFRQTVKKRQTKERSQADHRPQARTDSEGNTGDKFQKNPEEFGERFFDLFHFV